jgi:hypothetical protein
MGGSADLSRRFARQALEKRAQKRYKGSQDSKTRAMARRRRGLHLPIQILLE